MNWSSGCSAANRSAGIGMASTFGSARSDRRKILRSHCKKEVTRGSSSIRGFDVLHRPLGDGDAFRTAAADRKPREVKLELADARTAAPVHRHVNGFRHGLFRRAYMQPD